MMSFEFMTGAMFFALVNFIILVVFLFIMAHLGMMLYKRKKIKWSVALVAGILGLFFLFNSSIQPKNSILVPINRPLIEYQENTKTGEIISPPSRTKNLEGFTPLKKE